MGSGSSAPQQKQQNAKEDKALRTGLVSDVIISLPADMVAPSGGFAIDIGSSMAKIIYRSNKEYKLGEPIEKPEDASKGKVHYALFPRNDVDGIIQYLKDNCDFKRDSDGVVAVNSSGVGGSTFKNKFKKDLNAKISVVSEFEAFCNGFTSLSVLSTKEELVHPLPPKAQKMADDIKAQMEEAKTAEAGEKIGFGFEVKKEEEGEEKKEDEGGNPHLPCLLAMCGSGSGFFQINKDGTHRIFEGPMIGGRSFYGLASYLGGTNDFEKLVEMAGKGDGKSADIWTSDLIPPKDELAKLDAEDTELYDQMAAFDMCTFPMGKLVHQTQANIKKEDLVYSAYNTSAGLHFQFVNMLSQITSVKKVFFCGNLFNNETGRELVYIWKGLNDAFYPPEFIVDLQFIKNGGMLGVLGAFMAKQKEESKEDTKEETKEDTKEETKEEAPQTKQ